MGYHVLQIYQSRRVYQNQQQTQAIIYYSDFFIALFHYIHVGPIIFNQRHSDELHKMDLLGPD